MLRNLKKVICFTASAILFLVGTTVHADSFPLTRAFASMEKGKDNPAKTDCEEQYFPKWEVKELSSLPIQVMLTKKGGEWSAGPAVGLNVYGLWFNMLNNECVSEGTKYVPSNDVKQLSAMVSLSTDYVLFQTPGTDNENENKDKVEGGLMAGGKVGLLFDWAWKNGENPNRVSLGVIGSYGYLFPSTGDTPNWTWAVGPAVQFSK